MGIVIISILQLKTYVYICFVLISRRLCENEFVFCDLQVDVCSLSVMLYFCQLMCCLHQNLWLVLMNCFWEIKFQSGTTISKGPCCNESLTFAVKSSHLLLSI